MTAMFWSLIVTWIGWRPCSEIPKVT